MVLKTMESRNLREEEGTVCKTGDTAGEESIIGYLITYIYLFLFFGLYKAIFSKTNIHFHIYLHISRG